MKVMCAQNEVKLTLWTLIVDCLLYVSAKLHPCAFAQYNCKDFLVKPILHFANDTFISGLFHGQPVKELKTFFGDEIF